MIKLAFQTNATQAKPKAKRGDRSDVFVKETSTQIKNDLVWWPCCFCNGWVLVYVWGRGEKCKCGAKRIKRQGCEGWKRDGQEMFFL
jgi:hypothetical protein